MSASLTATRVLLAVMLLIVSASALAPLAYADEEPSAAAEETTEKRLTLAELSVLFTEHKYALWVRFASIGLSVVIGLAMIVRYWLFQDKVKGGLIEPPPVARVPVLAPAWKALMLVGAAAFVVPGFLAVIALSAFGTQHAQVIGMIALGVSTLALAAWVVLRRKRMITDPDPSEEVVVPRRGPIRAFGLGIWAFCVASVLVMPAFMASAAVLELSGEVEPQELVSDVVTAPDWVLPIFVLVFGVFVAPFTEECMFRALLYPSIKDAAGGGRRGAILSALCVSALFAAIHTSWVALLPLFILALVLTWVYEKTGSLAAVVVAHALNNFLTLLPLLMVRL